MPFDQDKTKKEKTVFPRIAKDLIDNKFDTVHLFKRQQKMVYVPEIEESRPRSSTFPMFPSIVNKFKKTIRYHQRSRSKGSDSEEDDTFKLPCLPSLTDSKSVIGAAIVARSRRRGFSRQTQSLRIRNQSTMSDPLPDISIRQGLSGKGRRPSSLVIDGCAYFTMDIPVTSLCTTEL